MPKKIEYINLFFLLTIMLLTELLQLFSSQLNINKDEFNIIVTTNNIKLNQRLTLAKKEPKEPKEPEKKETKEKKEQINTTTITCVINEELTNNVTEKRSRGRPKKQCNAITKTHTIDNNVNYEIVEEITHDNKIYYKTDAGVLLDNDYNMKGVIVDGVILMK